MTKQEEIREGIADIEHQQWVFWASSLLPMMEELVINHKAFCDCSLCARVHRWQVLTTLSYDELTEEQKDQDREWADKVLILEDKLGVVIKVDASATPGRELPKPPVKEPFSIDGRHTKRVILQTQQDMLNAGYVAWDPLIKE